MLGAIIGDIAGSKFEFNPTNDYNFDMFGPGHDFTDDTICTVAVADAILRRRDYGESIHEWCRAYPHPKGSYGGRFHLWVNSDRPAPYGSFGNGSAMRVSAVGWAFDDGLTVMAEAARSAECTHNHPEGLKGAQAVALAIFLARKGISKEAILSTISDTFGYSTDIDLNSVRNRFDETCQGTVPVAFSIIARSRSFEDAVRRAVSLGADADTLGAITGSIAQPIWGIPAWMSTEALGYLPPAMQRVVGDFETSLSTHKTRI